MDFELSMTCTVTIALPGLCLTAADTRLNFVNKDGNPWIIDGKIGALVLNSGYELTSPDRSRKIRRIGNAWAAGTGDNVGIQLAFLRLQSLVACSDNTFSEIWASEREGLRALAQSETGFTSAELDKTQLTVAVPGSTSGVLTLSFSPAAAPAFSSGEYVVTWPPGVLPDDSERAHESFHQALLAGFETSNLLDIVRAVIRVVWFASERCSTVGPLVQIGLAVEASDKGLTHYYLEGNGNELLNLDDDELKSLLHREP